MTDSNESELDALMRRLARLEEEVSGIRLAVQDAAQAGVLASIGAMSETTEGRAESMRKLTEKLLEMHRHLGAGEPGKVDQNG